VKPGTVTIRFIVPGEINPRDALACLSNEEKLRAGRFHFPKDSIHWMACRAGLRKVLGQITGLSPLDVPLLISENGKPLLAAPFQHLHFNLSHCDDLAVVACSSDGPVGVDLEPFRRAPELLECVATFCHPVETTSLPVSGEARASQLLKIWTAKEAVLKALGSGLFTAPETLRIDFERQPATGIPDVPMEGVTDQHIHEIKHPLGLHQLMISAPPGVTKFDIEF